MIRKIRLLAYSVAIVAGALLFQPVLSQAVLIERDLFAVGDGLITLDTDTNLEWLDLTQTFNLSAVQILSGAGGWTGLGFTYATTAQVTALFLASDPSNVIINSSTSGNFAGASLLLNLLGCTEDNGDGYKYGKGFAGPNEPGLGSIHRPWFNVYTYYVACPMAQVSNKTVSQSMA